MGVARDAKKIILDISVLIFIQTITYTESIPLKKKGY